MRSAPLVLLLASLAHAAPIDSTGFPQVATIHGRVLCPDGKPAPFANLIVVGTRRGAQTDDQGRYRLTLVPLGLHNVHAFLSGYESVRMPIEVSDGDNAIATITLGPAFAETLLFVRTEFHETVQPGELVAEIVPAREHWKVFEPLEFTVRIHNRSDRAIVLIKSGWREGPKLDLKISAPFDAYAQPKEVSIDGGGITLSAEAWRHEFVELAPGDSFDPYSGDLPDWVRRGLPTRPGKYTATFRYSTLDPKLGVCSRAVTPELTELLARLPAVELVAKATFKVDF